MIKSIAIPLAITISLLLSACTMALSPAITPTPIAGGLFTTPFPADPFVTPGVTGQASHLINPVWGTVPEADVYPTPMVVIVDSSQQRFVMVEDYRGRHVVNVESIPINNCSGQDTIRISVARSKTYSSSIEVGTEATVGIDEIVKFAVATQYNVSLGESRNYEVNVEFSASPGTNTIYTVEWVETWIVGRIFSVAELNNGKMNPVQYFVKSELQVNIPDSKTQSCSP